MKITVVPVPFDAAAGSTPLAKVLQDQLNDSDAPGRRLVQVLQPNGGGAYALAIFEDPSN